MRIVDEDRPRQRGLAARSVSVLRKIADVLAAQGNLAEALGSFHQARKIREQFGEFGPRQCAEWQRDLSVSYEKIGDVLLAQGNLAEALKLLHDGLAICEGLANTNPANASLQFDVVLSNWKLLMTLHVVSALSSPRSAK